MVDEIDRKILNVVQREFPVVSHPYKSVAKSLGLTEEEVLNRLTRLKESGFIRRIGAIIDPRVLGWVSTLCAARVPEKSIEEFISVVNLIPGVTHNYERKAYYNIWFTLTAPTWGSVEEIIRDVSNKTGIKEIVHLPAKEIFKVMVQFNF